MPERAVGDLTTTVTLTNGAPQGATRPAYIFGPGPTAVPLPAGVVRSLVTLYVPFGTSLVETSGGPPVEPATSGTEGGRPYVSFIVDVPAGQSRSVVLSLRTAPSPGAAHALVVVPSPRIRPTTLELAVATDAGDMSGSVELDATWVFVAGRTADRAAAPAFR